MTEPTNPRAYAWCISFRDMREGSAPHSGDVAIGCMDGSWWVDWDRLHTMREFETLTMREKGAEPIAQSTVLLLDLLIMARGKLREVTMERADEIARAYGAMLREPWLRAIGVGVEGKAE